MAIAIHDRLAESTVLGVAYFLDELRRARATARRNAWWG